MMGERAFLKDGRVKIDVDGGMVGGSSVGGIEDADVSRVLLDELVAIDEIESVALLMCFGWVGIFLLENIDKVGCGEECL